MSFERLNSMTQPIHMFLLRISPSGVRKRGRGRAGLLVWLCKLCPHVCGHKRVYLCGGGSEINFRSWNCSSGHHPAVFVCLDRACLVDFADWPRNLSPSAFSMQNFTFLMWFWELNSDSHACAVWMMLTELAPSPLCDNFIILFLFEIEPRDLHVVSTNSITELYPADQLLALNPIGPLRGRDQVLADSYGFSLPSVSHAFL